MQAARAATEPDRSTNHTLDAGHATAAPHTANPQGASAPAVPASTTTKGQLSLFVAAPNSQPSGSAPAPRMAPATKAAPTTALLAQPAPDARIVGVNGTLALPNKAGIVTVAAATAAPSAPLGTAHSVTARSVTPAPVAPLGILAPALIAQNTPSAARHAAVAHITQVDFPAATTFKADPPPALPAEVTSLPAGGKVIKVPSLQLPPLSKPLPMWMQAAAVRVDGLDRALPPRMPSGSLDGTRLAQDPTAPPVRQPANPLTSSDRLPNQIEVATSTFVVLLTTTDLQTVAVADPSIADVAVVNSRAVLLNGKTPGVTSLVIVDGQKIRQYSVRVTPATGTRPVDVAQAIGLPGVSVRALKDALVLEGEVANQEEGKRALEIASIYSPKVINQLSIRDTGGTVVAPEVVQAEKVKDLIGNPAVTVRAVGDTIVLSGTVTSPQQIQDADVIAHAASKNVLNMLHLPTLSVEQVRTSLGAAAVSPTPEEIANRFGANPPLVVRESGGTLVLEGALPSQAAVDQAYQTALRSGMPVVNNLFVMEKLTAEQALAGLVTNAIHMPGVTASGTIKRMVLQGIVPDTNAATAAEQIARGYTGQVDNLLMTANPQAVDVEVAIMEISKNDLKNLGMQYGSVQITSEGFTGGTVVTDANGNQTISPITRTRTVDTGTFNEGQVLAANGFAGLGPTRVLDAMRYRLTALATSGNSRLLSKPHTTVLSGRTATFQVGGQVPVPSGSTTGAAGTSTTLVFKDFGIMMDIIPVASRDGAITMRVRTEISQPDFTLAATVNGTKVPGFSRRVSISEVTVPKGGALALSGLIQNNVTKNISKIPLLSSLPVFGPLFQSRSFQRNETEVAIFVMPTLLANPLLPGQLAPAAPFAIGNNTNEATELGTGTVNNGATAPHLSITTGER